MITNTGFFDTDTGIEYENIGDTQVVIRPVHATDDADYIVVEGNEAKFIMKVMTLSSNRSELEIRRCK